VWWISQGTCGQLCRVAFLCVGLGASEVGQNWAEINLIASRPSDRRYHVRGFDSGRFCIHGGIEVSTNGLVDDLWCITPEAFKFHLGSATFWVEFALGSCWELRVSVSIVLQTLEQIYVLVDWIAIESSAKQATMQTCVPTIWESRAIEEFDMTVGDAVANKDASEMESQSVDTEWLYDDRQGETGSFGGSRARAKDL